MTIPSDFINLTDLPDSDYGAELAIAVESSDISEPTKKLLLSKIASSSQVNNLHTKRESIEWKAGLKVTNPLQLYTYNGVEYLPKAETVPFTTGSSFDVNNWFLSELSTKSYSNSLLSTNSNLSTDNRFDVINGDVENNHLVDSDIDTVSGRRYTTAKERSGLDYLSETSQLKAESTSFWGGTQINIIGDSISQCAYSRNNLDNLWNSIVKKNINYEISESSYGFVTLAQGGFPDNSNAEVHDVTLTGSWTVSNTDQLSPSGYSVTSSTLGNSITIKVPVFQDLFDIWYLPIYTGACRVYINNVLIGGIRDLSGDGTFPNKLKDANFVLKNSGDGYCYIKIEVASNIQVKFFGIQYRNYGDTVEINNFSHSGRRFTHLTTSMINKIFGSAKTVICALGHNDFTDADRDDAYFQQLLNRVGDVSRICNEKNVKLIVVDFCWHKSIANSRTRRVLHDLQYAVKGCKYVNIPDYILPNGEHLSYPDMKDKYHLFDDWSHPNEYGHKIIGETVSKSMQLAHTSRRQATNNDQYFKPISLISNQLTQDKNPKKTSTAFKIVNKKLILKLSLSKSSSGNLSAGEYKLFNVGVSNIIQQIKAGGIISYPDPTPPFSILLSSSGALSVVVHKDDTTANISGIFEFLL